MEFAPSHTFPINFTGSKPCGAHMMVVSASACIFYIMDLHCWYLSVYLNIVPSDFDMCVYLIYVYYIIRSIYIYNMYIWLDTSIDMIRYIYILNTSYTCRVTVTNVLVYWKSPIHSAIVWNVPHLISWILCILRHLEPVRSPSCRVSRGPVRISLGGTCCLVVS